MTGRHRLASRRDHEVIAIEHEGARYKIGFGREFTPPAQLGPVMEVFINEQKVNSSLDVLCSDGAILMSLLLQYGHPADQIAASLKRNPDGSPGSLLGVVAKLINQANHKGG
jgi:hypothetical protein